jgi:hypothetical protein
MPYVAAVISPTMRAGMPTEPMIHGTIWVQGSEDCQMPRRSLEELAPMEWIPVGGGPI